MQEHIQKALTYLNQANYSGYFEEMGNAVPTEMLARFSQFKQEFLHGNLAFDFSQRLETFAKEVLQMLNHQHTGEIKPLTMNHKEHLNQLIALGKLGQALEELLAATKENGQEDLANGLVLLASRYHRNEGANQKNTLDLRDYQIELNKITATLLNYVDEYEPTGKFVFKPVRNSGGSTGNNTNVTGNGNIVISQVDNTNININTAQNTNEDKTPPRNTVFISYSHQDKEVAQRVKTSLEAVGMLVTIDSDAIGAGEDIKSFIEKCVAQNYYTLSIVSTKSLSSSWVAMESVNTFYAQKVMEKRFIAAYIDKGFFKRTFVEDALDEVDKEIEDIQAAISKRLDKKRNIQDLQNELGRYNDLQHHLPAIVQRLRESLSVDISGDNFENGMQKIVDTMKN